MLRLLRPRQWVKNAFVLMPLIFAAKFMNPAVVVNALIAMALFCVAASSTYILNDLMDVDKDRRHPTKSRTRPIASGEVTESAARAVLALLYITLVTALVVFPGVALIIVGYILLNMAYSLKLKNMPVIDLFCIAVGFVLRVYAGAKSISVPLSSWMFITTLCLALYLAAIKRRQELNLSGSAGREILSHYTVALMDKYAEIAMVGSIVFYSLFVITVRPALDISIPLVLFGLFRYWYIVECQERGESPTDALLNDAPLLLTVLAWMGACVYALWPS